MFHHDLTSSNTSSDHNIGEFEQVEDVSLVSVAGGVSGPRESHSMKIILAAAAARHLSHVTRH